MPTDHVETLARLWQAACLDAPTRPSAQVIDGGFVLQITGNHSNWADLLRNNGVPGSAQQCIEGNTLSVRWPSLADHFFAGNGPLASVLPDYEKRQQQIQMARGVQRAIEMGMPAVVEAGTGTGKSFAYLAIALAMNKRVVVSTSNKALQMQLYRKDVPFLFSLPPFLGKSVSLAQGKNNFVCLHKFQDDMTGAIAVTNQSLIDWVESTETGSVEDMPFELSVQERTAILLDDGCTGQNCPRYGDCFYFESKRRRQTADVVICNHALLALHYIYPMANILPPFDLLVIDEAHKLPDYVRSAMGVEFAWADIDDLLKKATEKYDVDVAQARSCLMRFITDVRLYVGDKKDKEVAVGHSCQFVHAPELVAATIAVAREAWPEEQRASGADQMRQSRFANRLRNMADKVNQFAQHSDGYARWINQETGFSFYKMPYDVSATIAGLCVPEDPIPGTVVVDYTHCTRCGRTLTADTVHILNERPYGPDCVRYVDLLGDAELVDLATWLTDRNFSSLFEIDTGPPQYTTALTSATLAAPELDAFRRECGLEQAFEIKVESPFDYARNALLYVPNSGTPEPGNPAYQDYLLDEIERLVEYSDGGAFVLFTSKSAMELAAAALRPPLQRRGHPTFLQGTMPKLQIAREFRSHSRAVLFATKSFWEGVDIPGDALRLVIIDKLPFAAPSPLGTARAAALLQHARDVLGYTGYKLEFYPFNTLSLPEMILDLKQGVGRLIRSATDVGAICILDARIHTKKYGRQVLKALPPAPLTSDRTVVESFYRNRRGGAL